MSTVQEREVALKAGQETAVNIPPATVATGKTRSWLWGWLALLVAIGGGIGVHLAITANEPPMETEIYTQFLVGALGIALVAGVVQTFWGGLRRWMHEMCPILAAGFVVLCLWEIITTGKRWLPMPFFPSAAGVLGALVVDGSVILEHAWHSLLLLMKGYALGVAVGLVCGVCIGWFRFARYWGMPVLKLIGPVPATAWIPVAMIITKFIGAPSGSSAVGLIALAVWFPMTMLTASGISNVRSSYLDVARTLGAGRAFLIFRVALPAAMPSIFIGLFMGLSASFLTLVVAESVGVEAGLGWYITWTQGWAEYKKVFAALVIMAAFFSTIMTLLFKVRDWVLVWQKGTIKW
jgi:NitT/TauT family transport system permease protein